MIIDLRHRARAACADRHGGAVVNGERANLFAGRSGIEARFPDSLQDRLAAARSRHRHAGRDDGGVRRSASGSAGDSRSPGSIPGTAQLGDFVRLMLPPRPGTWAQLPAIPEGAWARRWRLRCSARSAARCWPSRWRSSRPRNVVANRIVHFLARRLLDTIRGVDMLIWALIWINVVGLGPFAGILAIAVSAISARSASCSPRRSRPPTSGRSRACVSTGGSHVHARPLRPAAAGHSR